MRKLKCVVSILIGSLLGLVASCSTRPKPPPEPEPPADKEVTSAEETPEPPKKQEELPVRRPMLE
ncbi:MAG: hypothetical protein HN919_19415 [Verrucomicrobia bacterium]|jgi:hypothetical protein|nr:hypothetical protein [Verrucomicrobiota bacterium]MBT7068472.1 hypothetical protein [Verrucomicrobiota bacterium]